MIDGGGPFTSTSTGTNSHNHNHNHNNSSHAHNLIRSILFRHTSGPTSGAKTASSSGQSSATATTTTSRTANSSLETSPNHPLYAAGIVGNIHGNGSGKMRVTPQVGTASTAASGGRGTSQNLHGGNRKNFPKFPSLLLGNHQGGNNNPPHHRHQGDGPTLNASNANPSAVVRYAVPRRSGVLGRYHRTVGGLSASGHRRGARRQQQQEALRARAVDQAKEGGGAGAPAEVVRHAQIHPRPSAQAQPRGQVQGHGQPQGQAAGNTTNNTTPQANLVANLRHATHITTDRPPYTNVPAPAPLESTLHRSSSSAAIPIPSHHIKRTASELQLCEDEMRAEYRDRVMYVRCYPAIAGATTARRMTMQATAAHTGTIQYHQQHHQQQQQQQYSQGPYNQEQQVPTNQEQAGWRIDAYRRSTAPPVLSHGSGEADWLLYDDHPLDGSSPSACGGDGAGAGVGAAINPSTAAAAEVPPDGSANPRPSYADEVEVEVKVKVEPSPSSSPILVQNPTPPKDVVKATKGAATTEKGAGGWPVACSQTRRNISILRQASETMYSTTTSTATATTSAATTGTNTTPSSSNPASRATSRTTSREEGDFNPYCHQDDAGHGQMILDGDGYLEGELHDYEHPGPMPPRSAGGRATGRKNSASSYEDVFVIDDL